MIFPHSSSQVSIPPQSLLLDLLRDFSYFHCSSSIFIPNPILYKMSNNAYVTYISRADFSSEFVAPFNHLTGLLCFDFGLQSLNSSCSIFSRDLGDSQKWIVYECQLVCFDVVVALEHSFVALQILWMWTIEPKYQPVLPHIYYFTCSVSPISLAQNELHVYILKNFGECSITYLLGFFVWCQ